MTRKTETLPNETKPARRRPLQARAAHTVQSIFEATDRVLAEQGEAALTTNRIAQRAGVSIGTLYQYFDSKESIVLAMLDQERQQVLRTLDASLGGAWPAHDDPRAPLRSFVRHYIEAFGSGAPGRRQLVRLAWRLDHHPALAQSMRAASDTIALQLQRLRHPQLRAPTPAMAYALTRLISGAVRAAALEESPLLGSAEFEDELVRACWGVIGAPDDAAPARLRA